MYRTDCGTANPVLLNRLWKINTSCDPARQIFIYQWGAEGLEGYHMLKSDWRAIMTPHKATLDSMRTPVWILYPIDVSHLSVNFLCLLLLQCIYLNAQHTPQPPPPTPSPQLRSLFRLQPYPQAPTNQLSPQWGIFNLRNYTKCNTIFVWVLISNSVRPALQTTLTNRYEQQP